MFGSITVERFYPRGNKTPRYRLRYSSRQTWLVDGFTCGSYKFRRDAERRASELQTNRSAFRKE